MENCVTPMEKHQERVLTDGDRSRVMGASQVGSVSLPNGAVIPSFESAADMATHMGACVQAGCIMHYLAQLDFKDDKAHIVPTPLFPLGALTAYTAKNLGQTVTVEQAEWFNAHRGGEQGDYSQGMAAKIGAVVKCLQDKPNSKRAYIIIPNNTVPDARCDADAKCMQLLNLMLGRTLAGDLSLNASVVFRAQAVEIFPKNIHFIGELLKTVCRQLGGGVRVGSLLYHANFLVSTREA